MSKVETPTSVPAPASQVPDPKIKDVNLKKALKGKNWLLYKGGNTLIIDDVKGLDLVCRPNIPVNITGINKNLLHMSDTLQRTFNEQMMETITPQEAKKINDNISTIKYSNPVNIPVSPAGNRHPETKIEEMDITDEIVTDVIKGRPLEDSLEKFYKTHPNETITYAEKRDLLLEELKKKLKPQTASSLMSATKYKASNAYSPPNPQTDLSPADQFRDAGHRAVDAITDLLVAYRRI